MSDTYIVLYVHRGLHIAVCNEGMNAFAGSYGCTSGCLSTGFCLLNNAAIAVIHATNSIGIISKPFVESAEFLGGPLS